VAKPKNVRILRARRAQVILQQVARKYMITLDEIRSDDRCARLVEARREYCLRVKAEGIGSVITAKVLHRNQDTVRYHLNPKMQRARQLRYLTKRAAAETRCQN
jgi:hypothetical protein